MEILEVELDSPNPDVQLAYYAERLALPLEDDAVRLGATLLRFRQGVTPGYHIALSIPENQIEDARRWLTARATILGGETFDFRHWNAHAIYFEDADGNVLELIARHDLPNASHAPFTSASLLAVNEVGVAVPDPPDAIRAFEHALGLPTFSGNRSTFTALGSSDGLLIVVPVGHKWFPTARVAAEARLRVLAVTPLEGEVTLGELAVVGTPSPS